jgi:hypothetical protein
MSVTVTLKISIATEFLERAIELFLRGDSYHAALHLAGAAEEILNVHARAIEFPDGTRMAPTFDQIKDATISVLAPATPAEKARAEKWTHDRMTIAKNSVKHMRGARDKHVQFDSEVEAEEVISRAISTFFQVQPAMGLPVVRLIEAFDRAMRGESAQ